MCLNGNTIFFKYNCMEAKNCNFFKKNSNTKRYDNYKTDVTKMLKYGSVNKCKEKLNSNVKEVVEYGDIIEIVDIDNNINKKFLIAKINNNSLGKIPSLCIGKKINYEFYDNNKKYRIVNIKKSII